MGNKFGIALLVHLLFCDASLLLANSIFPVRGFDQVLSDREALERLESYRDYVASDLNKTTFHEAYSFLFRFRHMPRRGPDFFCTGSLSGPFLGNGCSRLELDSSPHLEVESTYLFINQSNPEVWKKKPNLTQPIKLSAEELFFPIVPGMNQSPFDLLMPFVFWEAKYHNSGRVAGRPSHVFHFPCPSWVRHLKPEWSYLTMALDHAYQAPLRVETFGNGYLPDKTFVLRSFKRIKSTWIVKAIDFKDRLSGSTTRFEITSAALDLDLEPSLFSPEGMMRSISVNLESYENLN